MKKLLLLVSLFASLQLSAATYVTNALGTGTTLLVLGRADVSSITVLPASGSAVYSFYDIDRAGTTYTNSAYTNYTQYSTNIITTYVNPSGTTNTFTNNVLFSTANPVAAAAVTLPIAVSVGAPQDQLVTLPVSHIFTRGIAVNNSATNGTVIITYR